MTPGCGTPLAFFYVSPVTVGTFVQMFLFLVRVNVTSAFGVRQVMGVFAVLLAVFSVVAASFAPFLLFRAFLSFGLVVTFFLFAFLSRFAV